MSIIGERGQRDTHHLILLKFPSIRLAGQMREGGDMLKSCHQQPPQLVFTRHRQHEDIDDQSDRNPPSIRLEVGEKEALVESAVQESSVDSVKREDDAVEVERDVGGTAKADEGGEIDPDGEDETLTGGRVA